MGTSRSRVEDPEGEIRKVFREAGYADGWTNVVIEDFKNSLPVAFPEEYEQLKKDSDWLQCLESAGVDNWEGYDHARAIERGEEDW